MENDNCLFSDTHMFVSPTFGEITYDEMLSYINQYYNLWKDYGEISITVGSDSQNKTILCKMVTSVCVVCKGHGGIFFYRVSKLDRINNVRKKLYEETTRSLLLADDLVVSLSTEYPEVYANCGISIHVDAGNAEKGKTKDIVSGIAGWVRSSGFDCCTKDSETYPYNSSSVCDKISK